MGLAAASLQPDLTRPAPSGDALPPTGGWDEHRVDVVAQEVRPWGVGGPPMPRAGRADGASSSSSSAAATAAATDAVVVVRAAGWARDAGGGVVAAVELSWDGGRRYHPARIDVLAPDARWRFVWGEEPWQQAHGEPPDHEADLDGGVWKLRVADDSGNVAVVDL